MTRVKIVLEVELPSDYSEILVDEVIADAIHEGCDGEVIDSSKFEVLD